MGIDRESHETNKRNAFKPPPFTGRHSFDGVTINVICRPIEDRRSVVEKKPSRPGSARPMRSNVITR